MCSLLGEAMLRSIGQIVRTLCAISYFMAAPLAQQRDTAHSAGTAGTGRSARRAPAVAAYSAILPATSLYFLETIAKKN
jgi:hypothetical protein